MTRARGFVMTPKSCCSLPLSSEAGLPNEKRPKHCNHESQDQSYSKNYVSGIAWQRKIDIGFCERFRKQAEASGMIIEDQNVSDRFAPGTNRDRWWNNCEGSLSPWLLRITKTSEIRYAKPFRISSRGRTRSRCSRPIAVKSRSVHDSTILRLLRRPPLCLRGIFRSHGLETGCSLVWLRPRSRRSIFRYLSCSGA